MEQKLKKRVTVRSGTRVWAGMFPVFIGGRKRGVASLDVVRKKSIRSNLHFKVYVDGKRVQGTIVLPNQLAPDWHAILVRSGRVRKLKTHKWCWKKFRFEYTEDG